MLYFKYYIATEYSLINPKKATIQWIYKSAVELASHLDVDRSTIYKVLKKADGRFSDRGKHKCYHNLKLSRSNDIKIDNCNRTDEGILYKPVVYQ